MWTHDPSPRHVACMLTAVVSASRLLNLLSANPLRDILNLDTWQGGTVGEDSDDLGDVFRRRRRIGRRPTENNYPKPPSEEGTRLMGSGLFGSNPYYVDELKKRKRAIATRLMWRELGVYPDGVRKRERRSIAQVCPRRKSALMSAQSSCL